MQRKDYSNIDIKGQKFGRLTALKKLMALSHNGFLCVIVAKKYN